jgi:hypothetical protein
MRPLPEKKPNEVFVLKNADVFEQLNVFFTPEGQDEMRRRLLGTPESFEIANRSFLHMAQETPEIYQYLSRQNAHNYLDKINNLLKMPEITTILEIDSSIPLQLSSLLKLGRKGKEYQERTLMKLEKRLQMLQQKKKNFLNIQKHRQYPLEKLADNLKKDFILTDGPTEAIPGQTHWQFEDKFYMRYYPRGHGDIYLKRLMSQLAKSSNPTASNVFQQITQKNSQSCTMCHNTEDIGSSTIVHWKALELGALEKRFTKFNHAKHFSLLTEEGCRDCHQVQEHSLWSEKTPLYNNFVPIEKEQCSSCHNDHQVSSDCLTCHNYHVGTYNFPKFSSSLQKQHNVANSKSKR